MTTTRAEDRLLRQAHATARAFRRCMIRKGDVTSPELDHLLGCLDRLAHLSAMADPRVPPVLTDPNRRATDDPDD